MTRFRSARTLSFIAAAVVVAIAVIAALELTNTTHWFHKAPADKTQQITQAGNIQQPAPTANETPAGTPIEHTDTPSSSATGGATDTGGSASPTTDSSKWITSKSGNITVKQPVADSTLKSGDVLAGTAKVDEVHFRLIDNAKGVIAEGVLHVVDGKFSGKLGFGASSSSGRLDVFSTDSTGVELNEIQIAVRF